MSSKTHKAQSRANHTLIAPVFKRRLFLCLQLLLPFAFRFLVVCDCLCCFPLILPISSASLSLFSSTSAPIEQFLAALNIPSAPLSGSVCSWRLTFCCRNNEHSSAEQLIKQIERSFHSAIDDRQYLLLLRLQIVCQRLDTGWAIVAGSVAVNGVAHRVVPHSYFFPSIDCLPLILEVSFLVSACCF